MDKRIKVAIKLLGVTEFEISKNKLEKYRSRVFSIVDVSSRKLLPDTDHEWGYSDYLVGTMFEPHQSANLTLAITNAPLEENYYLRRISDNRCVLSMFETKEILVGRQIAFEKFIIRNIYELILIMYRNKMIIPVSLYTSSHDDIRKCLFDMNGIKTDIVYSSIRPIICEKCTSDLLEAGVESITINKVSNELKKINIEVSKRIIIFIKNHVLISILISSIWAIVLNIIANLVFG